MTTHEPARVACSLGVGHRDLWEAILWLRELGGGDVQLLRWVPSHLNDEANTLASMGRQLHPNNLLPPSKPRRMGWVGAGTH